MKAEKILLFRGRGLMSMLIRWQTRSIYSHAAVQLSDESIIEAWQGAGVRQKNLTNWNNIDVFLVSDISEIQKISVAEFLLKQIGKKYDLIGVFRFITRIKPPTNDKWFCSELVFEAYKYANVNLLERISSAKVSPFLLSISPRLTRY